MNRHSIICALATVSVLALASPLLSASQKTAGSVSSAKPATNTESSSAQKSAKKIPERAGRTTSPATGSSATSQKSGLTIPEKSLAGPSEPSSTAGTALPSDLKLDWVSINQGGAIALSNGDLVMGLSIAQPVAGEVSSGDLTMGLGFWYGGAAASGGCSCPHQTDLDTDGFSTLLDLGLLIDILFVGGVDPPNPGCPASRGDFDNDGFQTILDLGKLVDYLFAGGADPCDPCNPVQGTCLN